MEPALISRARAEKKVIIQDFIKISILTEVEGNDGVW